MVERLRPRRAKLPKLMVLTTSEEIYATERWKRLSMVLRARHPVCQQCGLDLTTEVHHVTPIEQAPHLAFEPSNLLCLCRQCHQQQHGLPCRTPRL